MLRVVATPRDRPGAARYRFGIERFRGTARSARPMTGSCRIAFDARTATPVVLPTVRQRIAAGPKGVGVEGWAWWEADV